MIFKKKWYVVQYKSNSRIKAIVNLERQNIEVFCPLLEVSGILNNKFVKKKTNLFPGYFFISFNETFPWRKINSTYGVLKIICFGKSPSTIPNVIINKIKDECTNDVIKNKVNIVNGDSVRIKKGPFSNFVGQVLKIGANKRIWVILDLMKTTKNISTNLENLIKLT